MIRLIGNQESNYFLDQVILLMIAIVLLRKLTENGLILQTMLHIIMINIYRMKSLTEVISNKPNYLEVHICQIVRLIKDNNFLKMSKREGNFITLNEIVKKVGKDPLRYFMISSKSETPMDFDMDKVIEKNKDNPVFYCQYAYARASSVINKSKTFNEF